MRGLAVGGEDEETVVARPLRRGFVFVYRECHPPRGRRSRFERDEVDVGEALRRVPIGHAQRVEREPAVGADRGRACRAHLDDVHEIHWAALLRCCAALLGSERGENGEADSMKDSEAAGLVFVVHKFLLSPAGRWRSRQVIAQPAGGRSSRSRPDGRNGRTVSACRSGSTRRPPRGGSQRLRSGSSE